MSDLAILPETGVFDITVQRGATFRQEFLVRQPAEDPEDPPTIFDLSDFEGTAQVRSRGSLLLTFDVTIDVDLGKVTVEATPAQSAAMKVAPDAEWDLYLSDGAGEAFYLVRGSVEIVAQVTTSG